MKRIIFLLLLTVLFEGCYDKDIIITREYIINENWSKKNDDPPGGNSIAIFRLKLKADSIMSPLSDISERELLSKLILDSSFRWFANVRIEEGGTYNNRKIYFNKDNGFTWLDDVRNERTGVLGNLELGVWYKFSYLVTYPYFIYIYIDSSNKVHRFDINKANY